MPEKTNIRRIYASRFGIDHRTVQARKSTIIYRKMSHLKRCKEPGSQFHELLPMEDSRN